MGEYIKGKGFFVGTYTADELSAGKDKVDVAEMKQKTECLYTNTEFIKKKGEIIGMKVYVCNIEDMKV